MRRRLLLVVVATTSLVVVAFAVPLGTLVRAVARDRALSAAERERERIRHAGVSDRTAQEGQTEKHTAPAAAPAAPSEGPAPFRPPLAEQSGAPAGGDVEPDKKDGEE